MKTLALTLEQYDKIISTLLSGIPLRGNRLGLQPNHRVAMALILEVNLGLRISDILRLRLCDFTGDDSGYRLEMETKTGKARCFTVPIPVFMYIESYCLRYDISPELRILPISRNTVVSILKKVCDHLGYERIAALSFRKFYKAEVCKDGGYDIALVQRLLQYNTTDVSIGAGSRQPEEATPDHTHLL